MNNWNPYTNQAYSAPNTGAQPGYDFSQMPQGPGPMQMRQPQQRSTNQPNMFNVQPTQPEGPKMADYFGKIVDNIGDIKYSDVPKDGQPAIFPFRDLSGIVVRSCNEYGTIDEAVYVKKEQDNTQSVDPFQVLYSKLEQLEAKINALSAPIVAPPEQTSEPAPKSTKKKEVASNE